MVSSFFGNLAGVAFLLAFSTHSAWCSDETGIAFEFELPECNPEGGFVLLNKCVCKAGYTGTFCEVLLFIDETDATRTGFFVDEPEDIHNRFKRQSDTAQDDGSGDNPTETTTPTKTFQVRMTITSLNFEPSLRNMSSSLAQNLSTRITKEVAKRMNGTSFVNMTISSFENGSVIVNGFLFYDTTNQTLILLSDQLQLRLKNSTEFTFASISVDDFDECQNESTNTCGITNATCVNNVGSFECVCRPGFTQGNSMSTCVSLCETQVCLNGGECVVNNNSTLCSCPNLFTGDQCQESVYTLQQAVIGVSIVLGVLVLLAILVVTFLLCRYCRRKDTGSKSQDVPMGTGFRPKEEEELTYENPQDVSADENRASQFEPQAGTEFGTTTSTFKPDNGASAAVAASDDQDDKL